MSAEVKPIQSGQTPGTVAELDPNHSNAPATRVIVENPDKHDNVAISAPKNGVSVEIKDAGHKDEHSTSVNVTETPAPVNLVPPVGNYAGVDAEINRSINMMTSISPSETKPTIWPVWNTALTSLSAWGAFGGATLAGVPYAVGHAAIGASIGDTLRWALKGEKAGNHLASIFQKSEKPSLFEKIKRAVTAPSRFAILRSMRQDSLNLETAKVRALNPGTLERYSDGKIISHAATALQRARAGEVMVMSSRDDRQNWGSEVNGCLGRYKDSAVIASVMRAEYGRRLKERVVRVNGTDAYKQRMLQLEMMRFDEQIREKADLEDTKMHIKNIALNSAAIGLVAGAVTASPAIFKWAKGVVMNAYNSVSHGISSWWNSAATQKAIAIKQNDFYNFFNVKQNSQLKFLIPVSDGIKNGMNTIIGGGKWLFGIT
jgi:hypothetical protein